MHIDYIAIGRRIKNARKQKRYTQEKLAERLDVSIVYISQIENGKTKLSLEMLVQIAHILNEHPGYFLTGTTYSSENYLHSDVSQLLEKCSPQKRKLLINILSLIVQYPD